jgi:hypothetical protein
MKPALQKHVTALVTALVYVFMVIFWGGVRSLLALEDLFTRKHPLNEFYAVIGILH